MEATVENTLMQSNIRERERGGFRSLPTIKTHGCRSTWSITQFTTSLWPRRDNHTSLINCPLCFTTSSNTRKCNERELNSLRWSNTELVSSKTEKSSYCESLYVPSKTNHNSLSEFSNCWTLFLFILLHFPYLYA